MEQSTPPVPCRLYAILAREAPVGVIFRRGPSKWVQIIHWDTATDAFTPGQWFHGRIYEKRCDLSPDGTLLIYFAQKIGARMMADKEYTYAWTAISRPPYLTALALWPKGDCWDGGGLFLSRKSLWLNHPPGRMKPHTDHRPHGLEIMGNERGLGEDEPIFSRRLIRDGWEQTQEWQGEFIKSGFQRAYEERMKSGLPTDIEWLMSQQELVTASGYVTYLPGIRQRAQPNGEQMLTMTDTLVGFRKQYDFTVRDGNGPNYPITGAGWADWDQAGRLVFAQDGKLFAAADGFSQATAQELADLNRNKPETLEAPGWAKSWQEV